MQTFFSNQKPTIGVTTNQLPDVFSKLTEIGTVVVANEVLKTPSELAAFLKGCDIAVTLLTDPMNSAVISACPSLKLIANVAAGYNNIDIVEARKRGVAVTNTPGVLDESTADFVFCMMLCAARRVTEATCALREFPWGGWKLDDWLGHDIHGSTLGIFGMGRIGCAVARRALGFGMRVLYCNRTQLSFEEENLLNAKFVDKETLLKSSDHVVVLLPYSANTHHFIDATALNMMSSHATIVNAGRGGLVDEVALLHALENKQLAGAALDVFENEPQVRRELLSNKKILATPHIASATKLTRSNMVIAAVNNVKAYVERGVLINAIVSPHDLPQ
jgi:glyoxylate/hydroxypyruvate/2-ketogluconate reductase